MYNKAVRDEFYSAFKLIENDDMFSFCDAITALGRSVEFALKDFYNNYMHTFSQKDFEEIMECKNKENYSREFDKFPLGLILGFLDESKFVVKVGAKYNKPFNNTLKILKDNSPHSFVSIRNKAAHTRKDCIIDRDRIIKQYNFIANVLNELGFEDIYDYEITRYITRCNKFYNYFISISNKYVKESSLPSYNYTIDNSLLSEFQFYNRVSGRLESFNFIEDSGHANSGRLTKYNCLISGEGGIGKSTILYHIYEYCNNYNQTFVKKPFDKDKGYEDFCPIPIFISAHKFKISEDEDYDIKDLKADIARQVGCEEFSFFEEAEKFAYLYNEADSNKPFFIFLIDGLNEITYTINDIGEDLLNIMSEFTEKRIQVIITSRTNYQLDEKYQNRFKKIRAQGLTREKIKKYIKKQNSSDERDIDSKLNNIKIFDILKNPMLLTLYTGYKYDENELKEFDKEIKELQLESKLIIKETNRICISNIYWNYIEYRILFHNIFQPVIYREKVLAKKKHKQEEYLRRLTKQKHKQEVRQKFISELVPRIAWELVSQNLFSINISDNRIKKIIDPFYADNKVILNPDDFKEYDPIADIVEYMTRVGLLKCEDKILSFLHQNFRDFFAACHYIREYIVLTGKCEKKTDQIREKLKTEYLPSNLKLFVGELLNERENNSLNSKIDMPLKEILSQYKQRGKTEDLDDHTVENIFEIDKALDVLNPNDYFDLSIDRLNFNDVKANKMIAFIEQVLNNVPTDALMSEIIWNPLKKKLPLKSDEEAKTVGIPQNLLNLFMLSARCASNSNTEYVKEYFNIWFIWTRKLYKNKTDMPAKKWANKAIFNHVLRKDRIILLSGLLTNLLYNRLEKENVGTGDKGIFSIFNEVSNSKPYYMSLMNVLIVPEKIKVSEIVDTIYNLASQGGLAPSFAILIMNYYIFKNRGNYLGKQLINELVNKMNAEKDEEKKTYIRFRLISAINYCLQESLLDN